MMATAFLGYPIVLHDLITTITITTTTITTAITNNDLTPLMTNKDLITLMTSNYLMTFMPIIIPNKDHESDPLTS